MPSWSEPPAFAPSVPNLLADDDRVTYEYYYVVQSLAGAALYDFSSVHLSMITEQTVTRYKTSAPSTPVQDNALTFGYGIGHNGTVRIGCTATTPGGYANCFCTTEQKVFNGGSSADYDAIHGNAFDVLNYITTPSPTSLNGGNQTGEVISTSQDWSNLSGECLIKLIHTGTRVYYSLSITKYRNPPIGNPPTPPSIPGVPTGAFGLAATSSSLSSTPVLGATRFDGTGTFRFSVKVPASQSVSVERSTDLTTWTTQETIPSGADRVVWVSDNNISGVGSRVYRAKAGSTCAPRMVGFTQMTKPAGKQYVLAANNFDTGNGSRRLADIVGRTIPSGTQVYYSYNPSTSAWAAAASFDGYSWSSSSASVPLGKAFFLSSSNAVTLRMHGYLAAAPLDNTVPVTLDVRSSILPKAATLANLGLSPVENDSVSQWDVTAQGYRTDSFVDGAWEGDSGGSAPTIGAGQGIFMRKLNSASGRTWSQSLPSCP